MNKTVVSLTMEENLCSSLVTHILRLGAILKESLWRTNLKLFQVSPSDRLENEAVDSFPFGSYLTVLRPR